jgi:hypothetical protein
VLPSVRFRALIVAIVNWYNWESGWYIVPTDPRKRLFTP